MSIQSFDPASIFSDEVALHIFSYLGFKELGRCCQVSSAWSKLANDESLWGNYTRNYHCERLNKDSLKIVRQEFKPYNLISNDEIVKRIEDFLGKLSLGENGRFRCATAGGGSQTISLEFKGRKGPIPNTFADFQIVENFTSEEGFGNGSMTFLPSSRKRVKSLSCSKRVVLNERIITWEVASAKLLRVTLRFPELPNTNIHSPTDMEKSIEYIVARKLNSFAAFIIKEEICRIGLNECGL